MPSSIGRRADAAPWPQPRVPGPLDGITQALFSAAARARRARPFHPLGKSFDAVLQPLPKMPRDVPFLGDDARPALVRLSKAAGLPLGVPDVLGLAVRVPDAFGSKRHQDLLLSTAGALPLVRHLLVPATGFDRRIYSSLLCYRLHGRLALIGARWDGPPRRTPVTLERLDALVTGSGVRFLLLVADPRSSWEPVAELRLLRRIEDGESAALRFNPWNCSREMAPVGPLNHLRAAAYRASQRSATSP